MAVLVCVAGDVMLDVLVATPGPMQPDDDTPARVTLGARRPGGERGRLGAAPRPAGEALRPAQP